VAAQRLVSQRGGVIFLEKRYHECGECHTPLLLARSVIEEHVAAAHHQLTPAQYNARHMQVGYRQGCGSGSLLDPGSIRSADPYSESGAGSRRT